MGLLPRMGLACVFLLLALGTGPCQPYLAYKDVVYDPSIGAAGTLDVHLPTGGPSVGRPALIAIHGGDWMTGDKSWGDGVAAEFCPEGYVVIGVNYRLWSSLGGTWPAQITDVRNALRFVLKNADRYGIDPKRVASIGVSAGGHLATMLALRSGEDGVRTKVAVNLDGSHDMTLPARECMKDYDMIMGGMFGHAGPWSAAELRDLSTLPFVRPDVAVFSIHGVDDGEVGVANSDRLDAQLRRVGAVSEYHRIEGRLGNCHNECWTEPGARLAMHRFLRERL